jgi:5-methylcytosine-specific restriction endonuclease McrA
MASQIAQEPSGTTQTLSVVAGAVEPRSVDWGALKPNRLRDTSGRYAVSDQVAWLCECHDQPLLWVKSAKGGYFLCHVRKKERAREWARAHPPTAEQRHAWYLGDAEARRAAKRAYHAADPERARRQRRASYEKRREAEIAQAKAWQQANRERDNANERAWRARNPERTRAAINEAWHRRRARLASVPTDQWTRRDVWERDDGLCIYCGDDLDPQNWHVDHVIPIARGGSNLLSNVCASCPSCNLQKGVRTA